MVIYTELSTIEKDLGYPAKTYTDLVTIWKSITITCTFRRATEQSVNSPFPI